MTQTNPKRRFAQLSWSALAAALLGQSTPALAQPDLEPIAREAAPAAVLALVDCDANGDQPVMRHRIFGAVVFRVPCPSNTANQMQMVVFADDPLGRNAELLRFPGGDGLPPRTEVANVRLFAAPRAIGEITVDDEEAARLGYCRTERLWRLVQYRPVLVFRRTNRDCRGEGLWRVRLDRRTRAERALDWS